MGTENSFAMNFRIIIEYNLLRIIIEYNIMENKP